MEHRRAPCSYGGGGQLDVGKLRPEDVTLYDHFIVACALARPMIIEGGSEILDLWRSSSSAPIHSGGPSSSFAFLWWTDSPIAWYFLVLLQSIGRISAHSAGSDAVISSP